MCLNTRRLSKLPHRAFSLIEASIVLGVVGLVISGIWVAAATVQENMLANDIAKGLLTIKAAMQDQILMSQYPLGIQETNYLGATSGSRMGMAPADWIHSDLRMTTPAGHYINLSTADSWEYAGPTGFIAIDLSAGNQKFSKSLCIKVMMEVLPADGEMWADINGYQIFKAPSGTRGLSYITTACKAGGNYIGGLTLKFPLTRKN